MLRALSRPLVSVVERWVPSSLVFAVVLTAVVAALALGMTDVGGVEVVRGWGDGLTGLLEFMTQMALILLLGHTLANTRPMRRLLGAAARVPRNAVQAYAWVTLLASIGSLISWGLGLVVAALLAREVAVQGRERGIRLHFPLLVACGYAGFVVWHMGYSGSGPLVAATPDSFVGEATGGVVPVSETIFSSWNVVAVVVTVVAVTAAMASLRPRESDPVVELPTDVQSELDEHGHTESSMSGPSGGPSGGLGGGPGAAGPVKVAPTSPAERVDTSRVVTSVLGLALVVYLVTYFAQEGFALTLDIVNWTFLAAILLLVGGADELGSLVMNAARNVGDILIQFPLYAGILGIMTASGLITVFSDFFVTIASEDTLGLWAFLSGGLVNMFVPSGGGQFAVQAPIFLDAANQLGVKPSVVIMGVAYGDQWTNMIQPFWALPLLAIARLGIRDILGYTTIALLVSGVVFAGTMLVVGAG